MLTTPSALRTHLDDLLETPASNTVTPSLVTPPKHALLWDIQQYTQTTANEALRNVHFETRGFIGSGSAFVWNDTKKAANRVL